MSIVERDYILRLIEQFAEVLGRIAGLRQKGKFDDAEKLANETADHIFGYVRSTLDRVDAATAAGLLGHREKIMVYAALTTELAKITAMRGNMISAQLRRRRALELYLEAFRLGELDEQSRRAVELLRRELGATRMPPRYAELLARLPQR